jgi:3-oxoacyl-[acyl-carrier protein] reductase
MPDLLSRFSRNPLGSRLVKALGLPAAVVLARAAGPYLATPLLGKCVLAAAAPNGFAHEAVSHALEALGATPVVASSLDASARLDVLVFDATGCTTPAQLRALYDFFNPLTRRLAVGARVLVIAAEPLTATDVSEAAVARGVEGFTRSLAKEIGRRGATANLTYVARGAESRLAGLLPFFCGLPSAYVTGQVLHVTSHVAAPTALPMTQVLAGKTALVTGAARGIGAATAKRLAQEGARVVCLDVGAAQAALEQTAAEVGGIPLVLDVAAENAPKELADFIQAELGGLDVLVHNAGITRDKTLANMTPEQWDRVVQINLSAVLSIDEVLLGQQLLRAGGRVVCLSSVSGIAGNFGQTNYAATKAALMGYVAAQSAVLGARGISINAVAPGFIETPMTAEIPFATREISRRLNSLSQGGQPQDVAEAIAFLSSPGSYGVSGQTLRVCGQALIGA